MKYKEMDSFDQLFYFYAKNGYDDVLYSSLWTKFAERQAIIIEEKRNGVKIKKGEVFYLNELDKSRLKFFGGTEYSKFVGMKYMKEHKRKFDNAWIKKGKIIPPEFIPLDAVLVGGS